jgi:hypothetical protein
MNDTDDLIGKLCGELEPTKRRCPYRNMTIWLVLSVAYIVGVIAYFGPKVDLTAHMTNAAFLFEMAMAVAILISSAVASSFLSFPDGVQRGWTKNVALTLFGVFILWIFTNAIEEGMDISLFTLGSCSKGLIVEALPFIALVIMTARGHSTQPYWLMAMNVFAVSALGWIALRLTCSMYDSMIYGFLHYLLPFAVLGAGIGFFARKIFKW